MNRHLFLLLFLVFSIQLNSQSISIENINISALRPIKSNKFGISNIYSDSIKSINLGMDVPYLLSSTPSLTYSSDAGNNIGYSSLSIRGIDQKHIQVNINGVPYNDPESQNVYWVDIPSIVSNSKDIFIQRGLGFSSLGGVGFGGNISINTLVVDSVNTLKFGYGSFNTFHNSLSYNTFLPNKNVFIKAKFNSTNSDGYIDRASSNLKNFNLGLTKYWTTFNSSLMFNIGHEKTYQSWFGLLKDSFESNPTYNISGTDYEQKSGSPYLNQIDNFRQINIQQINNFNLSKTNKLGLVLFYTNGYGYYEEYKVNQKLEKYGINTTKRSDLIRQKWLDNHFYGINTTFNTYLNKKIKNIVGISYSIYDGNHFGKIKNIIDSNFSNIKNKSYYNGVSTKKEFTFFNKSIISLDKISLTADIQYKFINYNTIGNLDFYNNYIYNLNTVFINPKFGIEYKLNSNNLLFGFIGRGNKEPNRSDFFESKNDLLPESEGVVDIEINSIHKFKHSILNFTLFSMFFKNHLLNTGALNETGNSIRQNVNNTKLYGAEMEFSTLIFRKISLKSNIAFSKSNIPTYTQYTSNYDTLYNFLGQSTNIIENSNFAYSPNFISYIELKLLLHKSFSISLNNKIVSKQYLDNTSNENNIIPSYSITNFILEKKFNIVKKDDIIFNLLVNNIFNSKYYSNGYTSNTGNIITNNQKIIEAKDINYIYPQSGINFLSSISFNF